MGRVAKQTVPKQEQEEVQKQEAQQATEQETQQLQQAQPNENTMRLDVRIYPVKTDGALKANASVNINDFFAISKIRVLEGSKGMFVSMPQYRGQNGEYKDICFPCTAEARQVFDKAVLTAYEQKMTQIQSQEQAQEVSKQEQEQGQQMVGM